MRVPDSTLFRMHRQNINASRADIADAQLRAATGLRVHKPSDNPLAFARARGRTHRIERAQATLRTIDSTTGRLQLSESTLNEAGNLLARARELTVQLSNETWSAEDRAATAVEIRSIREQLRNLANTEHDGEYIFAGFTTDTPPYDSNYAFQSDTNVRRVEVTPGQRVDAHVNGATTFGGDAGATDVFAVLDGVVSALEANDPSALRATLDAQDAAHEQIIAARTQVGTLLNRLQVSRDITLQLHDRALEERGDLLEADPVEAAQELVRADGALQAAISIASRLPLPGLLRRG